MRYRRFHPPRIAAAGVATARIPRATLNGMRAEASEVIGRETLPFEGRIESCDAVSATCQY